MTHDQLLNKLNTFTQLKQDWDGYDALPINAEAIVTAAVMLEALAEKVPLLEWEIFPVPRGNIQIEHSGDDGYIEIECWPGEYDVFAENKNIRVSGGRQSLDDALGMLEDFLRQIG